MKIGTDMKIKTKLLTLVGVLGLLLAIVVAGGMKLASSIESDYKRIYNEDAYAATLAVQTGKYFSEARNELTRYLFRVDPAARQQSIQSMQGFDQKLDGIVDELEGLATNAGGKQSMAELKNEIAQYRVYRQALIQAQPAPGAPIETLNEAKAVHQSGDSLSKKFDQIAETAEQAAQTDMATEAANTQTLMLTCLVVAIIVVIIAVAVGVRLSQRISQRIDEISMAAGKIAEGNLSDAVSSDSDDELGMAADNFEHMRQSLNRSMGNIHVAAQQVAAGARNISDASVSLSQGAAEQASSVEELSSSISEISSQTASNADNAKKANELTLVTRQEAEAGDSSMKEMLAAMEAINVSSTNISKIIKVIDEIAFQTNILALNAAVEAARAGQHGKGFAVVAEEVRNLAARSAKAAKETTDMIEDSISKVENGQVIADKTAKALVSIMQHVSDVADLVDNIAQASEEQKLALQQIDQGVLQVSQVVQANSATSEETASASEELSAQADRLEETVSRFRLEGHSDGYSAPQPPAQKIMKPAAPAAAAPQPQLTRIGKPMKPKKIALTEEEGFGKY